MSTDVSVAFKASDNLTQSIRSMQKGVRDLSRDVTEYRKIQDDAFNKRTEVQLDITKAKRELKELAKAVKADKEGATEAFKAKQKEIDQLAQEYRKLGHVADDCSKAERQLQQDISRTSNAYPGRSLTSSLAKAGLGKMLADATGNYLNTSITSVLGTNVGGAVSGIAGGAMSGAAIGSMAGGAPGAAIGAAIGGLTGAINALSEKQKREDDYFRSEVQGLYGDVKADMAAGLQQGTDYSSNKELNLKGLGTLLGSNEKANKMYEDIRTYGINTPYQSASIINSAKQMLAYGVGEDSIMSTIRTLGDVAMGDQQKLDSLSYAYAQIQSAGVLRGQDLLQLTSAGFNPLQVLAEKQGKTLQDMQKAMSDGLVTAKDVAQAFSIATSEGGKFYNSAVRMMETYAGKDSMLKDIKADIEGAYGDGFTSERKRGLDQDIEAYNSEMGDKMKQAYGLIGHYEADMENKRQAQYLKTMESAMETTEYKEALAREDGLTMGRIMAEAEMKAKIEYKNSEEHKQRLESDLKLVTDIQDAVAADGAYVRYGEKMANEFSKGWSATLARNFTSNPSMHPELMGDDASFMTYADIKKQANSHATGLGRVPYNGYLTTLHEGERVLTKVEADKQDRKIGGVNIAKIADQIVIREEADIDNIASKLVERVRVASENYGGVH